MSKYESVLRHIENEAIAALLFVTVFTATLLLLGYLS